MSGAITPRPTSVSETPSRYELRYAFELVAVVNGGLAASRSAANRVVGLPLNPEATEVREIAAAAIGYTAGGVTAEEDGFLTREYVVSGHCGLAEKRGWSAGTKYRPGGAIFTDGNTLWRELRNLFRLYGELRQDPASRDRVVMAWHDFRNDDHWIIVPKAFNWPRTAAMHRLHYPYEIEFTAVAPYESLAKNLSDSGLLGLIKSKAGALRSAIGEITGALEDAKAFIDVVNGTIAAAIRGTIGAVTSLLAAANGIKQGLRDTLNLPRQLASSWRDLVDQWRLLVEDQEAADPWSPGSVVASQRLAQLEVAGQLIAGMDALLARRDAWATSRRDQVETRERLLAGNRGLSTGEVAIAAAGSTTAAARTLTARATPGSSARLEVDGARSRAAARTYTGLRSYVVRDGDTLLGIAVREVGDAEAWIDIRDANRLRAPYITRLGLPHTVAAGGVLMIPTFDADDAVAAGPGPGLDEDAAEDVLGIDLLLDDDGELEIDPSGTDVRVVRGTECYEQALRVRFETPLGANLVFPSFGIPTPIGQPNTQGLAQSVALGVRLAVLADPRTAQADQLVVRDDGDTLVVEIAAYPKGSRTGRIVRRTVE